MPAVQDVRGSFEQGRAAANERCQRGHYGALSRVPRLERLSLLEEMLLSPLRLYHVVIKVRPRLG